MQTTIIYGGEERTCRIVKARDESNAMIESRTPCFAPEVDAKEHLATSLTFYEYVMHIVRRGHLTIDTVECFVSQYL